MATRLTLALLCILSLLSGQEVQATNNRKIKVKVKYLEFGQRTKLEGAKVTCYTKTEDLLPGKSNDKAKRLTKTAKTGHDGRVTIKLPEKSVGKDVFCKVHGHNLFTVYTETKTVSRNTNHLHFGTVTTAPDRIARGDNGIYNGCGEFEESDTVLSAYDTIFAVVPVCNQYDVCFQNCDGETEYTCNKEFLILGRSQCEVEFDSTAGKEYCIKAMKVLYNYFTAWGNLFPLGTFSGDYLAYQILGGCVEGKSPEERTFIDRFDNWF